jgi:hypothetical protein
VDFTTGEAFTILYGVLNKQREMARTKTRLFS